MRKYIYIVIGCAFFSTLSAQNVGIFTENPQTLLHIDGAKNNPKDQAPSKDQQKDDVSIQESQGGINWGIGIISPKESSAQIELGGTKSGFVPNKVALTGTNDLLTVPNPIDGMLIYNTTDNVTLGLTPSLYYFTDGEWIKLYTREVVSTIEYRDLFGGSDTRPETIPNGGSFIPEDGSKAHENPDQASTMYWTDPTNPTTYGSKTINIPEDGSYAFSFRFYSQIALKNADRRLVLYLWALKDDVGSTANILDGAEIDIPQPKKVGYYTYNITLAAECKAGDNISFRVGRPSKFDSGTLIASPTMTVGETPSPMRTSLLFWKL